MKKCLAVMAAAMLAVAMCLGLTACEEDRQFYTLLEAYNEGLITDADLEAIKKVDEEDPVTFTDESQEMFKTQLLEHFDDLKGTLYYAEGEEDMYSFLKRALEDNVYYPNIIQYYGEYGGAIVLYVELLHNMFMISQDYYVGEYKFFTWYNSFYLVWTNPERMEFSLEEI